MSEFKKAGVAIVAISVDTAEESKPVIKSLGLSFPMLSDANLVVARAYGVVDEENGMAWPAVFVVAPDGRIAWRSLSETYKIRPEVADILAASKPAKPAPPKGARQHP